MHPEVRRYPYRPKQGAFFEVSAKNRQVPGCDHAVVNDFYFRVFKIHTLFTFF